MDRYVVLTTTTEQNLAKKTCEALEDAGIPVMLEHREIVDGADRASGYRLLVPFQFRQRAQLLADRTHRGGFVSNSGMVH